MNLKLLFIFVCALISFVLFGCKQDKIKFYRESGVQELMKNARESLNITQNEPPTTSKSKSGVVIYKENATMDTTGGRATFGPKDIEFGVPSN